MKLVRFGPPGREKPGIIDKDGHIRNLSKIVPDISGATLSSAGLAKIRKTRIEKLPKVPGKPRLGPCVGNVRHFVAIGLNYTDHAAEIGMPLPKEPIIFAKAPNSICGPNDNVIQPKGSTKLDYEVELCIVIGKRAQYIKSQKDAKNFIAGYCICNDVSERSFQIDRGGSQWDKGKGAENFGPVGPWLVTRDEIKDVQNLKMWTNVNGEKRQHGSTKTMIFGAEYLVWYCSQFYVLEPGDLITTGTPPGVAQGMKPPKFLKPGDVITMGIEGLGEQRQKVVKAK
ncbi:MAG TPA: fumarylacetoacetate hydrolase family protein [Xanthobacteraceae bacterium]|jgi:2-keto-4-pentenoate hydratase/2-oxohepta-3-ene-1,7-dioic acid hydratase in catechol pathway|nr:fumarylacetoacetate hydrolase family protein [Xanthobacteraceae bacterium]